MPKRYLSEDIIRVLKKNGFVFASQKGSHIKLFSVSSKAVVIVPANRKTVPAGTFASILRQSNLTKEDFI